MGGERWGVVVVTRDGGAKLGAAVRSALAEGVRPRCVVVVDNGSTDGSVEAMERAAPGVLVVREGCNTGFARAVNRGLRTLPDVEFCLLLNNDAELDAGALEAFAASFDAMPRVALAGGQLRYPDGRLQSAFAPLPTLREELVPRALLKLLWPERYRRVAATDETRLVESVFGACLAVRRAALEHVGLLDEDFFFYYEEVEWCRRAGLRGCSVAHVPAARAVHLLGHTALRSRSGARVEMERSKLMYFRKNAGPIGYAVLSGWLVVRAGVNAASGWVGAVARMRFGGERWEKTQAYGTLLLWHVRGRPKAWGLPGRCRS